MNEATTTTIPDIFQGQNIEKLDEIFKDRLERISQLGDPTTTNLVNGKGVVCAALVNL